MESRIIKYPTRDFLLNPHSPTFLLHNGFTAPQFDVSDIEMITIPTVKYTSLRDIMPNPPPPPAITSLANDSSWNEIPIKNPLVKQAALAYLQPMSTPPEAGNKGLFDKFKETCFCGAAGSGEFGCWKWLSGIVLKPAIDFFLGFCEGRGIDNCDVAEDEEEDGQHDPLDNVR